MDNIIRFIKSLYNKDKRKTYNYNDLLIEMLNCMTRDTYTSMKFIDRILPEINQKLAKKGYVMKKT
jgi:ATP-dependent Clp protease adapter protein ClpS